MSTVELAHRHAYRLGELNAEFFIDLKRLPPELTSLVPFFGTDGDVAQPPQCLGFTGAVTEVAGEGEGLGVVVAGLAVFPDEPLNFAQSPECVDFTGTVTELAGEGQGLGVVVAGLAVFPDEPLDFA